MTAPPPIPCSICGGIYYGYHACGGSKSLSNLPDPKNWTVVDPREKENLKARIAELESALTVLSSERARVAELEADASLLRQSRHVIVDGGWIDVGGDAPKGTP